jgi:hypothetical protein
METSGIEGILSLGADKEAVVGVVSRQLDSLVSVVNCLKMVSVW